MRVELQKRLVAAGAGIDTDFITRQRGMFSYSGLSKTQMQRLRTEFGVYGVDSGRICVAALNERNLDTVVAAIAQVTEKAAA
jgi:aromatic-amino-acid transaminase